MILTWPAARQTAHDLILEYGPDHRCKARHYTGTNAENGRLRAECFVGEILHRNGVSLSVLAYIDEYGQGDFPCVVLHQPKLGIGIEDRAASFLTRLQEQQDMYLPWGLCMTDAVMVGSTSPLYYIDKHPKECPFYDLKEAP